MSATRFHRIKTALAVTGASLLTTTLAVAAAPASAQAYVKPCPAAALCLWTGANRTGTMGVYRTDTLRDGARLSSSMAAKVSSAWNRTNGWVDLFMQPDCHGSGTSTLMVHPGNVGLGEEGYIPNLGKYSFNNVTRSVQLDDTNRGC